MAQVKTTNGKTFSSKKAATKANHGHLIVSAKGKKATKGK